MIIVIFDANFTQNWTIDYCRHGKLKTTTVKKEEEEEEWKKGGKEGIVGRGRKKRREESRKEWKDIAKEALEAQTTAF